jgi:DNA-binding XRE family transcriptional regulator
VDDNLGVIQPRENGTFAWKPTADQAKEADRILADSHTSWHSVDAILAEVIDSGLKMLRERYDMTQQELAVALDVTQPHISKLEQDQGLEGAPLRLLRKIAEVFCQRRLERARSLPTPKRRTAAGTAAVPAKAAARGRKAGHHH